MQALRSLEALRSLQNLQCPRGPVHVRIHKLAKSDGGTI
jgi:hypothetical protein